MEPRKLSKKEIKELRKQFPKNKLRIASTLIIASVMIFQLAVVSGFIYLLYLMLNYKW